MTVLSNMGKRLTLLVLIFVSFLSCAWSASISFIYGNTVSSVDFKELPKVGTVFKDDNNNVLIVSKSTKNAVVFDKISTHSNMEVGSKLTKYGHQNLLFLRASLNHVSLGWSISTVLYPLKPLVLTGTAFSFNSKLFNGFYLTAGFESDIVLSKLWSTNFTLIEDGGITGWCTAGILLSNNASFISCYGFSYRHFIGSFKWELGFSWIEVPNGLRYYSPFVGIGVSL